MYKRIDLLVEQIKYRHWFERSVFIATRNIVCFAEVDISRLTRAASIIAFILQI